MPIQLRLTAAVTVAITLFTASSMTIAQETDSTCFMRTASGTVVDMSGLCNPNAKPTPTRPSPEFTPPSPTSNPATVSKAECRTLRSAMKQADKALEKSNENSAKLIQVALQQAKTIEKLSIQDSTIKTLQLNAVEFYKGVAKFTRISEEIGPTPTQNQAFAASSYIGGLLMTYQYLDDSLTKYCGS